MCTKPSATSNLNCSKKNMKKFFNNEDWNEGYNNEDWNEGYNNAPPTMDGIKQELENMEPGEIKAFKLKTQTNLAKATLQNRNTALDFGVPVASLVFSILAIIVSFYPEEPTTYIASPFFLFFQAIVPVNNNNGIFGIVTNTLTLAALAIAICLIAGFCKNQTRKHQVFYYQTILNIIESIEKEREHSNRYDVSVHNTETGETKQFDAHLLPNNK